MFFANPPAPRSACWKVSPAGSTRPPAYPIHLLTRPRLERKVSSAIFGARGVTPSRPYPSASISQVPSLPGLPLLAGVGFLQTHSCSVEWGERTPAGEQVSAQRNACAEHKRVLYGPPQRGSFPGRFIKARLVSQGLAPLTQQRLDSTLGW